MNFFKNLQYNNIITESSWDSDKNGKKWEDYETITCPDGQVIDMVKLLDDQQRAKAALVHLAPMFGGFINNLKPIYTFRILTLATDGTHLFVNPQFTYNMDLTEKCFVMAHEIMHCLLNHMRRGKGHDHEKSNIAADYECNITLVDMGLFKLATMKNMKAYVDPKYSGWGYEKIYDNMGAQPTPPQSQNNSKLSDQAKNNSNQSSSSNGSGNGDGSNQVKSADYKAGWAKAMEDYKKGKLKL